MPIPIALRNELSKDPYYSTCARANEHSCSGRITWEHCWIYGGKQIQEKWAIIPLCERHHDVLSWQDKGDLNKTLNHRISLARATAEDLAKYPKKDWEYEKRLCIKST